jgi:phosphoesterase RecJ-like protein
MPGPSRADVQKARRRLAAAQHVAVVSHERPDGDAVGSLLAVTLALRALGKRVDAILPDGLPARFRFLPGAATVRRDLTSGVDLLLTVDCSTFDRLGLPPDLRPAINIDHHPTNTCFADVNLIEPQASATAEVIYDLAPRLGMTVNAEVATNLLAGIVTDTIGFRTASTTPHVLQVAAELMERGAGLTEVYEKALNLHNLAALRYWSHGLGRLECLDGLVWCALTLEDRRSADYRGNDDADLINLLGTIEGARIALIFVEQAGGRTKISWRSRPGINVARVAELFGGGGHDLAAGAMVSGEHDAILQAVLTATRTALGTAP